MKKYLALLFFVIVAMTGYSVSTVRTIKADKVLNPDVTSPSSVTWSYTGVAADTLTDNQDTIIYNITLNKAVPMNYYIKIGLDTIAGADTTCIININGRMFDDESWTLIETVTTDAVEAEVNTVIESMTDPDFSFTTAGHAIAGAPFNVQYVEEADTVLQYPAITFTEAAQSTTQTPSIKPCWRQIQVEIILAGDDSVGEGIELKDIRWYFQEAK